MKKLLIFDETKTMGHSCWVIQMLDRDLACQGSSMLDAFDRFKRVYPLDLELDAKRSDHVVLPAPPSYWKRFDEASPKGATISFGGIPEEFEFRVVVRGGGDGQPGGAVPSV